MEANSTKRRPFVFSGNGWADFEAVTLEWLGKAAATSWQRREPTIVAVPTRSHGFFLRELCLKHGLALAGVYFRTPGEFRDDLLRAFPQEKRAASREELRLFLSLAAADFPDDPLARSLAIDSDSLLKSLDNLWGAGHDKLPSQDQLLEKILSRFQGFLDQCGLRTAHELDRSLQSSARNSAPIFFATLVFGFSGRHWARLPILQALVHASETSTMLVWNPPNRASEIDRLWIGTWEEDLCSADPLFPENDLLSPLRELSEAVVSGSLLPAEKTATLPSYIRIGKNASEEARLILGQILLWLSQAGDSRIAVLFPKANPCFRELSDLLKQMDIPHNDTLGHASAHSPQEIQWNLWLQLQEKPTLDHLRSFAGSDRKQFESLLKEWRRLDRAFQQMLTDDLPLISLWLHSRDKEDEEQARTIDELIVLPAKASLGDFLAKSMGACERHGWKAYGQRIEQRSQSLGSLKPQILERSLFLSWLREVVRTPNRQRAASGHHPYARVQILGYPDAELQPWTHVIFTGLNEGSWPPSEEEGGWLHSNEMEILNRQVTLPGNQGEGHFTIRPGFSRLLAPEEKRAIANRGLLSLLEEVRDSCCFTASLTLPDSPHREASPSDFLVKVFWVIHGTAIDSETFNRLAVQSKSWLSTLQLPKPGKEPYSLPAVSFAQEAWLARRQTEEAFGPFDFCFSSKPPKPLWLPAKAWQQAVHNPAPIWFERVLRVFKETRYAAEDPSRLAEGTWVHFWLKQAFAPGETQDRLDRLTQAANLDQTATQALYQSVRRSLPQLWASQWEEALAKSVELAKALNRETGWSPLETEFRIQPPVAVKLEGSRPLMLSGTVDLILCDARDPLPTEKNWAGMNLHVIDYKTGSDKQLSLDRLLKGEGLQIALYLLALEAKGAAKVTGQILTPKGKFADELEAEEAKSATRIWQALLSMQEEARLGWKGELRPEFSFGSDYPLATLAIDPDLLEERWFLTHPSLETGEP